MQAVWLQDNRLRLRNDLPTPQPKAGEALIKVRLAGICGTDLELIKGYYPFDGIPGHEFVGDIVLAADAPQRIGQRVVGDINVACGCCPDCHAGRSKHCRDRTVLGIKESHGAFAEYLTLPLDNLIVVPNRISDEQAVFAEPLAAALQIQGQMPIDAANRVLVVGAGRLGQLVAQTLAATGCRIQVAARYPKQRQCLENVGLEWLDEDEIPTSVYDVAIEASGSSGGFSLARRAVHAGGTIVLKSTFKGDLSVNLSSLVVDEITVMGSRCGSMDDALAFLASGKIDPGAIIDGRYALGQALKAFEHASQSGILKILLNMQT